MGLQNIQEELVFTPKLLPSTGGSVPGASVLACIAGDVIDLTTVAALITTGCQTTTLTRKPGGSTATVSSHAFTTDAAVYGYFDSTVVAVGMTRTIRVVSFPANFLTTRYNPDPSGASSPAKFLTRGNLQLWAQAATAAQITTAIEVTTPVIASLWAIPNATQALFANG